MASVVLYLDADVFLALIKQEDRFKEAVKAFLSKHKQEELVTSTLTCLELWFYLYRNQKGEEALDAIRAMHAICAVVNYDVSELESATLLAQQYTLSPADAVHATIAMKCGTIVSSDHSFDNIPGLKKHDFSKES